MKKWKKMEEEEEDWKVALESRIEDDFIKEEEGETDSLIKSSIFFFKNTKQIPNAQQWSSYPFQIYYSYKA